MARKAKKATPYEVITDRILELLEKGETPWRKPWAGGQEGMPRNLKSGKAYRGVNVFMLAIAGAGFDCNHWVTYKQAAAMGGQVRKGSKGFPVVFWKWLDGKDEQTGKAKRIPLLRYYTVFNALGQCDGLDDKIPAKAEPVADHDPIPECEAIVSSYRGPEIVHREARAYYSPVADRINMPKLELFESPEEYYSTLFHELGHSTGHKSRLDRLDQGSSFGDHSYSREELVAEMTAAYLCGMAGIENATIDNSAAYIRGWIKVLKGDAKLAVQAAAKAQKAADLILCVSWEDAKTEPEKAAQKAA